MFDCRFQLINAVPVPVVEFFGSMIFAPCPATCARASASSTLPLPRAFRPHGAGRRRSRWRGASGERGG